MKQEARVLLKGFYSRDTILVAKELLGKYLVLKKDKELKVGRIVETEAYPGVGDRASHSHKGVTPRTKVLFGEAGIVYVYLVYGMHYCLNVVTDKPKTGGAVLIRRVEPIKGLLGKTSGPGLVCKAYEIDKTFNGLALTKNPLTIREKIGERGPTKIGRGTRIGIDYSGQDRERLYRFQVAK